MTTKTNDTWHQTFAAMFSKHLTAAEIQTYQNEILAAFEGKTRPWIGEAADAIRSLADKWPKASAGQYVPAPSARDIIGEMKLRRREHATQSTAHFCTTINRVKLQNGGESWETRRYAEPSQDWQSRLKRTTAEERWTIICEPDKDEQCREREQFCDANRLPFQRFTPPASYGARVRGQEDVR